MYFKKFNGIAENDLSAKNEIETKTCSAVIIIYIDLEFLPKYTTQRGP